MRNTGKRNKIRTGNSPRRFYSRSTSPEVELRKESEDMIEEVDEDDEEETQLETQAPTESQLERFEETQLPLQTLDGTGELEKDSKSEESSTYIEEDDDNEDIQHDEQVSEVYGDEEGEGEEMREEEEEEEESEVEEEQKKESEKQTSVFVDSISSAEEETSSEGDGQNTSSEEHEESSEEKAMAKRPRKSMNEKRKKNGNSDSDASTAVKESSLKKRRGRTKFTNKKRASLRSNQNASVRRIKDSLNYGSIHMAEGVREVISESMNFFAKKVLIEAEIFVRDAGRERLTHQDVSNAVASVVPYSPISERMHCKIGYSIRNWMTFLSKRKEEKSTTLGEGDAVDQGTLPNEKQKASRVENGCGLNISISSLKNLAQKVTPTIGGISNNVSFIALGAAVEVIGEIIIHRAVGAMISASVKKKFSETSATIKDTEENDLDYFFGVSFKKTGPLTLTKDNVNLALHYMVNTEQIRNYSSNVVYSHRRLDYDTELEKALEQNAKRAPNFRSKKRSLKQKVKARVEDTNKNGLLNPKEITSYLVHDNTIPLIYRDFKLSNTSTVVNIHSEAIPETMCRELRTLINGKGVMQSDRTTLRTMGVLWNNIAETEIAQAWYPHHRE